MIVLNDSVVNQSHASGAMRMRILFGYTAVGCPTRMTDSAVGCPLDDLITVFSECLYFSSLLRKTDAGILHHKSNSCTVVTAVFQPCKSI